MLGVVWWGEANQLVGVVQVYDTIPRIVVLLKIRYIKKESSEPVLLATHHAYCQAANEFWKFGNWKHSHGKYALLKWRAEEHTGGYGSMTAGWAPPTITSHPSHFIYPSDPHRSERC